MSAAEDETFSPQNITVLGVLLFIAIILGEVVIGPNRDNAVVAAEPADTMEDMTLRLQPVVMLEDMRNNMTVALAASDSASKTPAELYQSACLACHTTGVAGAPKIGEADAWTVRLEKGLDGLVASAINGIGAMPPRGGSQYDDEQLRVVVEYILAESK